MYNSSSLLQPFILSALSAGVDLALVILRDIMYGFLIREGEKRPVPKADCLPELGTSCWQRPPEPLIPSIPSPVLRPAQPQPFLPATSPQAGTEEQQCREASQSAKKKVFYGISACSDIPSAFSRTATVSVYEGD